MTCFSRSRKYQGIIVFVVAIALLGIASPKANAEDYVVLEGLRGIRYRHLQPEVDRLRAAGHRVTYLPWWRWRAARRRANGPVNLVGYSLGGSRAAFLANFVDVRKMELLDPVQLIGDIRLPNGVAETSVYRASQPSRVQSSAVIGRHREVTFSTDHSGIPQTYYSSRH